MVLELEWEGHLLAVHPLAGTRPPVGLAEPLPSAHLEEEEGTGRGAEDIWELEREGETRRRAGERRAGEGSGEGCSEQR